VNERQTAIGKTRRISGWVVIARALASFRREATLATTLTIDGRFAGEENARIELGWLLTATTDVARRGRCAKQKREACERELVPVLANAPQKPRDDASSSIGAPHLSTS
jgi:acyl-CoA thioesterase FadM